MGEHPILQSHPFFSSLFRWLDHLEMICFSAEKQKERLPTTENLRKFITALCMCIQFATIFSGRLQDCTYFDTPGTLQSKDDRGKWHPPLGKGNHILSKKPGSW